MYLVARYLKKYIGTQIEFIFITFGIRIIETVLVYNY